LRTFGAWLPSFYIPWASPQVNDCAPLVLVFLFLFMTGTAHWINSLAPLALDWGDFGDISPN